MTFWTRRKTEEEPVGKVILKFERKNEDLGKLTGGGATKDTEKNSGAVGSFLTGGRGLDL
jgi:hypothetical protein